MARTSRRCGGLVLLAVLLSACAALANGSVMLRDQNNTFDPFGSLPADFGPRIPPDGIEGLLLVADPEDACAPLSNPAPAQAWVALIVRSQRVHANCTFDVKVRNAQQAGAVAAIVYDDIYEALIIMSKPLGNPEPGIPAVFVSQRSGIMIKRLLTPTATVLITPMGDNMVVSMLMSAFAGVLAVGVVVATLYFYRRTRGAQAGALPGALGYSLLSGEQGMSAAQLRKLQVVMYERTRSRLSRDSASDAAAAEAGGEGSDEEASVDGMQGGGTAHMCMVCLDDYKDGDKLRVLPCRHRFHVSCIDQWLSNRKPLCPCCKHDALKPLPPPAGASGGAGGGAGSSGGGAGDAGSDDGQQGEMVALRFPLLGRRLRLWVRPRPSSAAAADSSAAAADSTGSSGGVGAGAGASSQPLPARAARGPPVRTLSSDATPQNFPGMHFVRRGDDGGASASSSFGAAASGIGDLEAGTRVPTAPGTSFAAGVSGGGAGGIGAGVGGGGGGGGSAARPAQQHTEIEAAEEPARPQGFGVGRGLRSPLLAWRERLSGGATGRGERPRSFVQRPQQQRGQRQPLLEEHEHAV